MSEPRSFIIRHLPEPYLGIKARANVERATRAAVEGLSIALAVAYCGCCKRHYDAEAFAMLAFIGFQREEENGPPILELRNCLFGSTIAAEVPGALRSIDADLIPDTERPVQ